ncbi:MAG: nucleic acid-binding protein [Spirochaetales bacterium]|nr:nucleic acid-binding protein [Spirochaetales bacterium]
MMQETFEKLRELQDVLSQKYEIEREISEIPKNLSTKIEMLNRLKKSYIDKNKKIEDTKKNIGMLKQKLIDAEIARENYEKQMDVIKTQREYEALDKEIRDATEKEQQLRKDILREEKEFEELVYSFESEEAMIKEQEEELQAEEDKNNQETDGKKDVLKDLEAEEAKITPFLDDEILFKFERIIRNKSGIGIVPVKNSVCTGCHMIFPAQFENDVRTGDKILFCPYCSRILYFEEGFGEEEDVVVAFNEDDFGHFSEDED